MTVWHKKLTPDLIAQYKTLPQLRLGPDDLITRDTDFWGPSADQLKGALGEHLPKWGALKTVNGAQSVENAGAFGPNQTIWRLTEPDKGIWVLNVTGEEHVAAAQRAGSPVVFGFYVRVDDIPDPETLYAYRVKELPAQDSWAIYNKRVGRSIAELKQLATETKKKLDAQTEAAKFEADIKRQEEEIERLKKGGLPEPATPSTPPAPPSSTPPAPGTWLSPDTSYELVASQGGTPIAVDLAWRQPRSYQWKLTDDPMAGFRLGGKPGAGPYVARGRSLAELGLPAFVVGRAADGHADVINGAALTALFGPDWAKP